MNEVTWWDAPSFSKTLVEFCIDPTCTSKLAALDAHECRQLLPFLTRLWIRNADWEEEAAANNNNNNTNNHRKIVDAVNSNGSDQAADIEEEDDEEEDEEEELFADFTVAILGKLRAYQQDTNHICAYLNADFCQIYEDVIRNLSTRKKSQALSVYSCGEFEAATPTARLLMIANVLFNGNIRSEENTVCKYSAIDYSLFDLDIYFQDLSDILCILHAELGEVISLSQFVFTLLHSQSAMCVNYVLNLIVNSIDSLFPIVDIILEGCSCGQIEMQRHKCLMATASCWPSLTSYIINECIRCHFLPSVILSMARQENLIAVLLSIFQFEYDRNWFVQFLRSPNKNPVEKQSVELMREDLVALCYECKRTPNLDLQLFKLYSGMRTFAGLKFNEAEVKALIEMILETNEINVAISFLLIYPPLIDQDLNFQRIIKWIKEKFNRSQQSILLVAIYCNSLQLRLLTDFASNLIGYRLQLKGNSLNLSRVFQQVFPDDMLLNEYMRTLPITPRLDAKVATGGGSATSSLSASSTSLGIHFLNQWLKTNSFVNKRHLDLNSWLFEQIKECVQPLHPAMISLINNYVMQLFNLNILNENRLMPLSSDSILEFFKQNYANYDCLITPKLLLLYYLLVYETKRRETLLTTSAILQNPSNQAGNPSSVTAAIVSSANKSTLEALLTYRYSNEIFDCIPINYFLIKAKEADFSIIYPSLLKLVINLFTQLCQVEHLLYEPASLTRQTKWANFDYIVDKLRHTKAAIQAGELTRNEAHMFQRNWLKAYSIHGRKLSLKTASVVLDWPDLSYDNMYSNPLTLLKSQDIELYKCGPLFQIVLFIVKECLWANRNRMEFATVENHLMILNESKAATVNQFNCAKALKDKQDLKNSLVAAQDMAVIQILLDLFMLIKKKSNELAAREMQCIICSFIHQMFIENSNLAELVHFQGYPKQLLPVLVSGVPSMHICLDFLPKLLSHTDIDKQIFAINLTAHLCAKYPIVKTYNVAKLAINVSLTILQTQTRDERRRFFKSIVDSVVIFYEKLPPLTQECMSLIVNAIQTKSIEIDHLPSLFSYDDTSTTTSTTKAKIF